MPVVSKSPEEMLWVPPMPGNASYVLRDAQKEIERLREEIRRLRAEVNVLRGTALKDEAPSSFKP